MDETSKCHELAKDPGSSLRAYLFPLARLVCLLALTKTEKILLLCSEKWLLSIALISFVLTVLLCWYELPINAKRFFTLTK
jgi:hypothetical protein